MYETKKSHLNWVKAARQRKAATEDEIKDRTVWVECDYTGGISRDRYFILSIDIAESFSSKNFWFNAALVNIV
jgi:hypothetical protein